MTRRRAVASPRCAVAAFVAFVLSTACAWADLPRSSASVFAGPMMDNTWQDILFEANTLRTRDAQLAGVSVSREWAWPRFGYIGIEASVMRHFGEQDHWELSVPLYLRSLRPERVWLPSLA